MRMRARTDQELGAVGGELSEGLSIDPQVGELLPSVGHLPAAEMTHRAG